MKKTTYMSALPEERSLPPGRSSSSRLRRSSAIVNSVNSNKGLQMNVRGDDCYGGINGSLQVGSPHLRHAQAGDRATLQNPKAGSTTVHGIAEEQQLGKLL